MKIIAAPDSYKGNLSSLQVADCIEAGIHLAEPEAQVIKVPVADGGEGTVEAFIAATHGSMEKITVNGPFMEKIESFYGILGDGKTAVIEMAAAAGLPLVPETLRNPNNTTTYGVGELIKAALDKGCRKIILGIGGSSTNDCGIGMAQALGFSFLDDQGRQLQNGLGGRQMSQVRDIDLTKTDQRLALAEFVVACDVKNPLFGTEGAAFIFGPQKGATPEMVKELDFGLQNMSSVINRVLGKDISNIPGSGAAGGLGGGVVAFLGAVLKPGIDILVESAGLEELVRDADLVITGEGRTDYQTSFGKVPVGIAEAAKLHNVPVICLSGSLGEGFEEVYKNGVDAAFSNINRPMTLKEAMFESCELIKNNAYAVTSLYKAILTHSKARSCNHSRQ